MSGTNVGIADIGFRIRDERERLKLSVAEFASGAGVSDRSQRNYEAGERIPDAAYLYAVGKLGADIDFILTGKKNVWSSLADDVSQECELLARVMSAVDSAIAKTGVALEPKQKANCILFIYRSARFGGPSDETVAEEAVKLAAG